MTSLPAVSTYLAMTLLHFSQAFCSPNSYANAFSFVFGLGLACPQRMCCPCECTKRVSHPFPCALLLSFGFLFVFVCKTSCSVSESLRLQREISTLLFRLRHHQEAPAEIKKHYARAVCVTDGCMEIPRTASLSLVLDEHSCIWARSCNGNW